MLINSVYKVMISNRITYAILGMKEILIEASKNTLADQIIVCISEKLGLKKSSCYKLAQ